MLEAAILATRTAFLPLDDIAAEFRKLAVIVKKTGGPQAAFGLLEGHLGKCIGAAGGLAKSGAAPSAKPQAANNP